MTDMIERVDRRPCRVPEDPDCPAPKHGSMGAYRAGCRCPSALQARERFYARRRYVAPAVGPGGACAARLHGTQYAYRAHGCRCEPAVAAEFNRRGRGNISISTQMNETLGYARRWRGPDQRVGRVGLLLAMGGFAADATQGEKMVAALRLSVRANSAGTGLLTLEEIAQRLGYDSRDSVTTLLRRPARLRKQRTQRRLADVKDKAVRVRRALERKAAS